MWLAQILLGLIILVVSVKSMEEVGLLVVVKLVKVQIVVLKMVLTSAPNTISRIVWYAKCVTQVFRSDQKLGHITPLNTTCHSFTIVNPPGIIVCIIPARAFPDKFLVRFFLFEVFRCDTGNR